MRVTHIGINDFRGIGKINLLLNGQNTVLFGKNGSGKSSILDCLAILLSRVSAGLSHNRAGAGRRQLLDHDIRNGSSVTNCQISVLHDNETYSWSLSKARKTSVGRIQHKNEVKTLVQHTLNSLERNPNASIPIAVYYPVNRAVLDIPIRIRKKHEFDQISAYEGALTSGADFRLFFEWFRNQEDLENEFRARLTSSYIDSQLEAVRVAIYSFLPGFSNLRVTRNPLRMVINKGERQLEIGQLSDGEKCMLAMVGDLARRLAIANPELKNPLEGQGVVMIDEVELHLHPSWQRSIISAFTQTFPNLQFILTTHSPQVLGEAYQMKAYMLQWGADGVQSEELLDLFGKDTNRLLEDYMETFSRDEQVRSDLSRLFRLIHEERWGEATSLYNMLAELLGDDEPELIKANILLKRWRRKNYETHM